MKCTRRQRSWRVNWAFMHKVVVGEEVGAILNFLKEQNAVCSSLGCINTTSTCPVFGVLSMTSLRTLLAAYLECIEADWDEQF